MIEPRRRAQIEELLGRELAEAELQPVASLDALSAAQRAVVAALAPRSVTVSLAYVTGVVPDARSAEASRFIDQLQSARTAYVKRPWSWAAGVGRWQFRIAPAAHETAAAALQRCATTLVARAAPFARAHALPEAQPPISISLDLNVETEDGAQQLASAAALALSLDGDGVRLVLTLDVDIYAAITWEFCNNTRLAAANAPRLAQFLAVIRDELHAQFVASDGLLPVTAAGFEAR